MCCTATNVKRVILGSREILCVTPSAMRVLLLVLPLLAAALAAETQQLLLSASSPQLLLQEALLSAAEDSQCARDLRDLQAFHVRSKTRARMWTRSRNFINANHPCNVTSDDTSTQSKLFISRTLNVSPTSLETVQVCVPASCPERLLQDAQDALLASQQRQHTARTSRSVSIDGVAVGAQHWAVLVLLVILVVVPIGVTIFEDRLTASLDAEPRWWRPLLAFSMRSGYSRLVAPDPPGSITCLNGLRVFSTLYIVFGHVFSMNFDDKRKQEMKGHPSYVFLVNYTSAVDTFLSIGGMLCCLSVFKELSRGHKFNFFKYAVHRFVRITPVLAIACLLAATWDDVIRADKTPTLANIPSLSCSPQWWIQLVYMSDYILPEENTCIFLIHTWYLSLDMQLYLLAPLVLLPLFWRPRWGWWWLGALSVAACLTPGILAAVYGLTGQLNILLSTADSNEMMRLVYYPLHSHSAPYLMGIIVGCLMHYWKVGSIKLELSQITSWALLVVSAVLILASLFSTYPFHVSPSPFSAVPSFFFNAFYRVLWSAGVLLLIIVCERKRGGIVNDFLSWRGFSILSRLSFSIYVIHIQFVYINNFATPGPTSWPFFYQIRDTTAVFGLSTISAFVLFLCVEQPFAQLESAVRNSLSRSQKEPLRSTPKP